MKLSRIALLGAAGLIALSFPAHAVGTTTATDTPLLTSGTNTAGAVQFAQRREMFTTSSGSVGFKKSKKKKPTKTK
jgi:hypothetical protein